MLLDVRIVLPQSNFPLPVLLITRYGLRTCFITCNPLAELSCRELGKRFNTIVTRLLSSTLQESQTLAYNRPGIFLVLLVG